MSISFNYFLSNCYFFNCSLSNEFSSLQKRVALIALSYFSCATLGYLFYRCCLFSKYNIRIQTQTVRHDQVKKKIEHSVKSLDLTVKESNKLIKESGFEKEGVERKEVLKLEEVLKPEEDEYKLIKSENLEIKQNVKGDKRQVFEKPKPANVLERKEIEKLSPIWIQGLLQLNNCNDTERKEYDMLRDKNEVTYRRFLDQVKLKCDNEEQELLQAKDDFYESDPPFLPGYLPWKMVSHCELVINKFDIQDMLNLYVWPDHLNEHLQLWIELQAKIKKVNGNKVHLLSLDILMVNLDEEDQNLLYHYYADYKRRFHGQVFGGIRRKEDYDDRRVLEPDPDLNLENDEEIKGLDEPVYFGLSINDLLKKKMI